MLDLLFGPAAGLAVAEAFIDKLHDVPSLTDERLASLMQESEPSRLLILDVREPDEFLVSHLEGAVRIDPDTTSEEFRQIFSGDVAGRTVVAYCSIGERSAVLLERVLGICREMGAQGAFNLRGGIFRWHANGRRLVDKDGASDRVHPLNPVWGMLVAQKGSGR
jgi:rhodanese-related sulfurtransferase